MTSAPWDFAQARAAAADASRMQQQAEEFVRDAARGFAMAEEAYRVRLATRITELHADGVAWTVCGDLARGDKDVARLRRERDIAEGVKEAAQHGAWRRAADRRDVQRFAEYSLRRDLMENGVSGLHTAELASA